jgi:hypothetical protein
MERFIREIRRGTKVRDHKFPGEGAVYKCLHDRKGFGLSGVERGQKRSPLPPARITA